MFGTAVTAEGVAQALAAYTRTILSGQAPMIASRPGTIRRSQGCAAWAAPL